MKKHLFLFLSLLCCMGVWGQNLETAVFNFSDPASLNPSPASDFETSNTLKVSDKTFTANGVSLSFDDQTSPIGVTLQKFTEGAYAGTYWLMPHMNSYVIFKAPEGGLIESIEIAQGSLRGNFSPAKGQKGDFDFSSSDYTCKWTADGGSYQTVKFFTSGSGSQFNKITVTYKPRKDVLTPTATSFDDGATVGSFSVLDLTFGSNVTLQSGVKATVASSDGKTSKDLTAAVSGAKLTLSLAEAITDDGTYKLTVPAGLVANKDGQTNAALTYTFTVKKDRATFNPTGVSPQEGYQESMSLNEPITITFDGLIGKVSDKPLELKLNGTTVNGVTFKISDDHKSIIGTFNVEVPMTDFGTYTLTLPEGYVHNAAYNIEDADRWNKAVTYSWVVSNKKPDSETMKAAKALLAKEGVGYPTKDSEARKALADLVNAETTPSDDDLKTAMTNFYKESNVELPATDKYYKIYGVNEKGAKLYLTYDGTAVNISSSEADAYSFKAEAKGEGKVAFSTLDGKYLHLLTKFDTYTGTSPKNVTAAYDASVNDLTLARLSVVDVDPSKTFGTFSVKGSLGKDPVSSEDVVVYDLLDFSLNNILTNPTYKDLYFKEKISSAFVFEESTKPAQESVDIEATLDKKTITSASDVIRLSFTKGDNIVLKDGVALSVTDKDGKAVDGVSATIKAVENATKDFDISFSGLTEGTYNLIIPEGAFSFTQDGKQVVSKEYKAEFTYSPKAAPLPTDFKHYYQWSGKLPAEGQDEYPKDYLQQFIILMDRLQTDGLVGNPNAKVELKETMNGTLMGVGHFESDPDHTDANYYAVKLVWDQPIDMVKVRTTQYTFIIPEGAFGDANYGKYLKDPSSVASSDCTVNDSYTKSYDINTTLTGIRDINAETNAKKVIYDLQGRRVERVTKTGIYIVNGKKMVIRK